MTGTMMHGAGEALSIDLWLLNEAMALELPAVVDSLGHRLIARGLPVDRLTVSFGLLNPSLLAGGLMWYPNRPLEFSQYALIDRDSGMYERSPFKAAADIGGWLDVALDETPDETYEIVPELKAMGLKHYTVIPIPSASGRHINVTIATKDPRGFSEPQRDLLRSILPALRAVVELKSLNAILHDVLAAYVGRYPAREIINGTVHRGETRKVYAAILVADLRGFTSISSMLPPEATAEVINRYYDVVVPPIEANGGEVLKFIGDAVLAIFPTAGTSKDGAALSALNAARAALATEVEPFVSDGVVAQIRFGIAIHLGEAVYGNVGSGDRLDFTVIGRDVNIASRLAALCSRLGRKFLVSEPVAEIGQRHGRTMVYGGAHDVRGLQRPVPVYLPDPDPSDVGADPSAVHVSFLTSN